MDPILLQKQLKNNNQDVMDFCEDLKAWGAELRKKEQKKPPETKQSLSKETTSKEKKKSGDTKSAKKCMSYSDWEKFDADKECEKVDEDSESDLTDEFDESVKEEALAQKETGNRHVKNGKWDEAIKCYTKAIDYFAYDPVFYANRALCYLKKNEMAKAEADCTISIKLDNTYVKAYQRRAAAKESLNKLEEAKLDLLRVLELEPKNTESKNNLEKLKHKIGSTKKVEAPEQQRPLSKFSASRQQQKVTPETFKQVDIEKPQTYWPSGDKVALVKAIKKPPHMRSKKPLKRIPIIEINSACPKTEIVQEDTRWPKKGSNPKTINIDDMKIIEHKYPENVTPPNLDKETKNLCNFDKVSKSKVENDVKPEVDIVLETPKTYVQFHATWKTLKDQNEMKYKYLKLINPRKLPDIFRESLETQVFSDILFVLSEYFIKYNDSLYEYLLYLSKIQRFGTFTMFLSLSDKNCLWKMFNHIKESTGQSEDVDDLIVKYELK